MDQVTHWTVVSLKKEWCRGKRKKKKNKNLLLRNRLEKGNM
jgi:hypothetical protein